MSGGLFQPAFIGPGGPELLVIMLALLVMFGAKDAPRVFRKLNDILNQIRRTAEHFKHEVMYSDLSEDRPSNESIGEYEEYGVGDGPGETNEPGVPEPEAADEAALEEGRHEKPL